MINENIIIYCLRQVIDIYLKVKKQLKDKVKIIKIDVDKNQSTAASFQVQGVPTLIIFKEGKQVWRQSGVVPANQLVALLESHF